MEEKHSIVEKEEKEHYLFYIYLSSKIPQKIWCLEVCDKRNLFE